jgi:hypothetical protein
MMQADVFAHHDLIAATKPGSVLMVCEPVEAVSNHGGTITLEAGLWLRVKFMAGCLWCEAAVDGRVETITIWARDFGALEPMH